MPGRSNFREERYQSVHLGLEDMEPGVVLFMAVGTCGVASSCPGRSRSIEFKPEPKVGINL